LIAYYRPNSDNHRPGNGRNGTFFDAIAAQMLLTVRQPSLFLLAIGVHTPIRNMTHLSRRTFLLGSMTMSVLPSTDTEPHYVFATAEYDIQMTLEYHDHCTDRDLKFLERSSGRHYCLSFNGEENRNCVSNFTGAIAVARYKISSKTRSGPSPLLREYVRDIDQSDRVAARPPFEGSIQVQHGLASDIQVFGYQDSSRPQNARTQEADDAWCLLRQNLYLKNDATPFLVVHWKHTLGSIRVLDIIPENGTLQVDSKPVRQR
jgi:hypothetical protein